MAVRQRRYPKDELAGNDSVVVVSHVAYLV